MEFQPYILVCKGRVKVPGDHGPKWAVRWTLTVVHPETAPQSWGPHYLIYRETANHKTAAQIAQSWAENRGLSVTPSGHEVFTIKEEQGMSTVSLGLRAP